MDPVNKSKITQNIVYMKRTLSHLDPIIDRMIEGGIFDLSDRNRIEAELAPHKQFNGFIHILVTSPEPKAYKVFRTALKAEGYSVVADRLDETTPRLAAPRSASSRQSTRSHRSVYNDAPVPDAAGASGKYLPNGSCHDCIETGSTMKKALENFNKNQQDFMAEILRLREEDWAKMEENRQRDRDEYQHQLDEWQQSIAQEPGVANITRRYVALQEQYDHLKEIQKGMRLKDSERRDKLQILNRDYVILSTKYEQLQQVHADMEKEMDNMKNLLSNTGTDDALDDGGNQEKNEHIIEQLEAEKCDLMLQLEEKVAEIADLQAQLDQQKELIEQRRLEQENLRPRTDSEREQKIDKLCEMVETLVKERTSVVNDNHKTAQRQKPITELKATRMPLNTRCQTFQNTPRQ